MIQSSSLGESDQCSHSMSSCLTATRSLSSTASSTGPTVGTRDSHTSDQEPPGSLTSGFRLFLENLKAYCWFDTFPEGQGVDGSSLSSPPPLEVKTSNEDLVRFEEAISVLLRRPLSRGTALACIQETQDYTRIPLCKQLEPWDCGK